MVLQSACLNRFIRPDTIEQPVPPLFITELILELENITLSPSLEIFLFCVEDLICG